MASTYSNLKIQLMATGENSGTWGNVTNDNLGVAIEQALVETATVTFASANVTLTLTNTNASQTARALRLDLTGTTGGARDLIVPAIQKPYIVNNGTADTITVKVTGQTGVAVPAGRSYLLYNNGTDVVNALEGISVVSGGTGLETLTAESVVIGNGTNAVKFVAPGTSTNVLTSNGTAWVSQAAASTTNANAITTGILSAGVGGTGANTLTSENVVIGNGTSAVKFVAPGTSGNVLTSNGTAWLSEAAAGGGGNYIAQFYTSPATWTKPATVKAVKVTVIAGGGGVGNNSGNAGGSSSFGPFCSATGGVGASGGGTFGAGGSGSGGNINANGAPGFLALGGCPPRHAIGGGSAFGFGQPVSATPNAPSPTVPGAGNAYGGGAAGPNGGGAGGGGGAIEYLDAPAIPGPVPVTVGGGGTGNSPPGGIPANRTGGAGLVIVEEFY
jgi:hypothetical protein